MKTFLSTVFAVRPAVAAPNVRTNSGSKVHAGHFAVRRIGSGYLAAAWCHQETAQDWEFTATSDDVTCSHCWFRLQRASRPVRGVTDQIEVTGCRFELQKELEERVLVRDPAPYFSFDDTPRPARSREIRQEVRDLKAMVAAATVADAEVVRGCIELGTERIAALLAEPDDGHAAAA